MTKKSVRPQAMSLTDVQRLTGDVAKKRHNDDCAFLLQRQATKEVKPISILTIEDGIFEMRSTTGDTSGVVGT